MELLKEEEHPAVAVVPAMPAVAPVTPETGPGGSYVTKVLRNQLAGWHWKGYKQVLEVLELVCPTQVQFDRARAQVLTLANEQEKTMKHIVTKALEESDVTEDARPRGR